MSPELCESVDKHGSTMCKRLVVDASDKVVQLQRPRWAA